MKVNDTVPVLIAGQQVAVATVKEVGEGTVTLIVPGTAVVMATRTEITNPPAQEPTGNQHILLDGVERTSAEPVAPEATSAPVGQNQSDVAPATNVETTTTVQETATVEQSPVQQSGGPVQQSGPVAPEAAPAGSDA